MAKRTISKSLESMSNGRLIATLMGIVTVTVSLSIIFSRLWVGDIGFNNEVISRKRAVNDTLQQNVEALPELLSNYDQMQRDGLAPSQVFEALPVTDDYAAFSGEVESMAALAPVQLTAVSLVSAPGGVAVTDPGQTESVPAPGSFPVSPVEVVFQISVNGSFANLQKFLTNLETARRPVKVLKADISGTEPSVTMALEVVTWYQPLTTIANDKETYTQQ